MAVQSPISGSFKCHEPLSGAESSLSPVIMLHGITGSGRIWKSIPQVIAEETKRKVYVLDARNHGDSEWSDVFNLDILIEDLDHFMNKMGIPKAILIGHSMGGKTSMGLTLSKPEKVDKLVVEDMTPGLIRDENRDNVLHLIALLKTSLSIIPPGSDEKTARKMVWDFVLSKLPPDQVSEKRRNDDGSVLPMKRTSEGYSWQTNLDLLEKSLHGYHGFNEQFSGVYDGDTLFIYGAKSTYEIDKDEEIILGFFPRAELFGLQDAGHNVHIDCPEEFTKKVIEFIR